MTFAKVRILDTPGFGDTRGPQHDELELHKKSIATHIQDHIATLNAVLILANGTVQSVTVGTEYILSAFLPKTLANNVAFLFTNVPGPLSFNISQEEIPESLKDAPEFLFDNPIAVQRTFLERINDPIHKHNKARIWQILRKEVKATEQRGLEMLVDLFDWLDGCAPHPTTEIMALYETSQALKTKITNTLAQMDQAAAEVDKLVKAVQTNSVSPLLYSHLAFLCMSNVGARGSGDN